MRDETPRIAYSLREIAKLTGVCYLTVFKLVHAGKLPAKKIGATWRVTKRDLEIFLRINGPADATK